MFCSRNPADVESTPTLGNRKWRTQKTPKKEHKDKIRLTHVDVTNKNMERTMEMMNTGDGEQTTSDK